MASIRDVFISYAHADQAWVEVLAENLHQSGLEVFFDDWEIGPGDVLVHRLDEGLRARNGVLVVSPAALERPWVQEEYAAMVTRAVDKQLPLIPVLLKDAEMPPLLASRVWVDFRGADGPVYEARVRELVKALKGERRGPPPRTGGPLKPPPNTGYQAQGPIHRTLHIGSKTATLSGGNEVTQAPVRSLDRSLDDLLWRVSRARRHWGLARDPLPYGPGARELEPLLDEVGRCLGEVFLPKPVAEALTADIAEAERLGSPLELALELADTLPNQVAELPWETLRLPGDGASGLPLALHPRVDLYRRLKGSGAAPVVQIPRPLRILVAIGSPEAQNARGELLDMEAELRRILDAVEPARKKGYAAVRILEYGTVAAIRAALEQERYHVLYISCHAAPGVLILEDGDGGEDWVSAGRLWREALPAGRSVALAVLAGCSTARDLANRTEAKEEALPGVARDLVAHGVPAVIAMQGPVGDRYATELADNLFAAVATWEEQPLPLRAFAEARRAIERERRADTTPRQPPPEWPTPALFTARDPLPLYETAADFEAVAVTAEPRFDRGVVARRIGDMVGRRREQRLLLRALRSEKGGGVLVHGIGGVGKSTLVAQVLHRLAEEGRLLASLYGLVDVDQVLAEVGGRLFYHSLAQKHDERHPLRQIANHLREPKMPWRERLDLVSRHVLGALPLVFLFDNFEDNLDTGRQVKDDLGELLALWLEDSGRSRLVFTCRYPFRLPEEMEESLEALHLGPLSLAETRKLVWRLPGLDALEPPEIQRAYEEVGGHPRALEYLDALLRGGAAKFPDVERRLKKALKSRGVEDPKRWRADTKGNLGTALAETVTLAADDVLLDALLGELEGKPLARRLLIGASVYRRPVDETGLVFQVSVPVERPADPERKRRLERVDELVRQAREEGKATDAASLGLTPEAVQQYLLDLQQELAPPVDPPEGFEDAKACLQALTLLAPAERAEDEALHWFVHRWTGGALARRASQEEQTAAHRAAAAFWRWRAGTLPQPPEQAIEDLLEARHHHHAADENDAAVEVTEWACSQLETWGAWEREERLLRESLTWVPQGSQKAAAFLHHLGILAQDRGDYDQALDWYRKSLAIKEALGNRAGMASTISQIGILFMEQDDAEAGIPWNLRSLMIRLEINVPEVRIDLYHLARQRQMLGDGRFREIVSRHLSLEDTDGLIELLDQQAAAEAASGEFSERGEAG